MNSKEYTYRVPYNLLLITAGSFIFSVGVKGVLVHQQFIVGGLYGIGLLIYYLSDLFSPGFWFLLLNIPIFLICFFYISRRFFFYSLYAALTLTACTMLIHLDFGFKNQTYAAIAGGLLCGAGSGMILRSLGSGGGMDVIAIILNQRFNLGIGRFYLIFNAVLFGFFLHFFTPDQFIASLIVVFLSSATIEYMLTLFNARKIALIISNQNHTIADELLGRYNQTSTFIKGFGAFSRKEQDILMTITNNMMLKQLENLVFSHDPNALFVVENTFNVIGSTFGKRKLY